MATLLAFHFSDHSAVAYFKEITATLRLLVEENVVLLEYDGSVSQAPVRANGGRTTKDLAWKLDESAAFPKTFDEFFERVTSCEILLKQLLDDHLTTYVTHSYFRALDEQYVRVCEFVSPNLVAFIKQTVDQNAKGWYKLLLNLEGMADVLHRSIVQNHPLDTIVRDRRIPSSVQALPQRVELSNRSEAVINKLAKVFKEAEKFTTPSHIFNDLQRFDESVLLSGQPPLAMPERTDELPMPDMSYMSYMVPRPARQIRQAPGNGSPHEEDGTVPRELDPGDPVAGGHTVPADGR